MPCRDADAEMCRAYAERRVHEWSRFSTYVSENPSARQRRPRTTLSGGRVIAWLPFRGDEDGGPPVPSPGAEPGPHALPTRRLEREQSGGGWKEGARECPPLSSTAFLCADGGTDVAQTAVARWVLAGECHDALLFARCGCRCARNRRVLRMSA